MILSKYFYLISTLYLALHCKPRPENYINKANKALKQEKVDIAIKYFQKAYELLLPKENFVLNNDIIFSNMVVAENRESFALLEKALDSKKSQDIYFFNISNNKKQNITIKGHVSYMSLSPKASFLLLQIKNQENINECHIQIWDIQKDKIFSLEPTVNCKHKSAISNNGIMVYIGNDYHIYYMDINSKSRVQQKWGNKTPDKPFKKQFAKASFYFSITDTLFMTYGNGGYYKLYILPPNNLKLISKKGSLNDIYFQYNTNMPGIIVGGVDNQKLTFFDPLSFEKIKFSIQLEYLEKISIFNEKMYSYLTPKSIMLQLDNKSIEIPFWGVYHFIGTDKNIYFLSGIGTVMKYNGFSHTQQTKELYKKIIELDESI